MSSSDYRVAESVWLEPGAALPPAGWYATPMSAAAAATFSQAAQRAAQRALVAGGDVWRARLGELVGHYWSGQPVELGYQSLMATAPQDARPLVELVYGQLLVSRKRHGALQHLDRGFAMLTALLRPADYFALLKRHELLRLLVLTEAGSSPLDLTDLLLEAKVIRRLRRGGRGRMQKPSHDDTVG
ncbi:MAG: hypothetical protein WCY26_00810 [Thiohalobacteraceae bacterium]